MRNTQIGIIGGGQLGMFLLQSAIEFPAHVSVYDPDPECSAAYFTKHYQQGAFDDKEAILNFAKDCDVVLFETEKANLEALFELKKQGKKVLSAPETLEWIQDKGSQRQKLTEAGFPSPDFELIDAEKVKDYQGPFPVVQKWRTGGYDGKGVNIIKSAEEMKKADTVDSVFEQAIEIDKELSVLIARDPHGNTAVYPPIEMVFDPVANLVDYLLAPARISKDTEEELLTLAKDIAEKLAFEGIYAIEFFLDSSGKLFVNEVAPRPHNSGHHTLSANVTSQYEQQIRMALDLPLGSTDMLSPCLMVNLLGEGEPGPTQYKGIEKAFTLPNVQYMFYGKSEVRPYRKMGHALILEASEEVALQRLQEIRNTLTICRYE